jgi:hypothetical protein
MVDMCVGEHYTMNFSRVKTKVTVGLISSFFPEKVRSPIEFFCLSVLLEDVYFL